MSKEQTAEIERAVRKVLGDVLSEASEDLSSSTPSNGEGLKRSFGSLNDDEDDATDIPPEVLPAVEKLSRDLSSEQATSLADLFQAIASQSEEEPEEGEPEEEIQQAMASSATGMELSSEAEAKAEGQRVARGGLRFIIKLIKKMARRSTTPRYGPPSGVKPLSSNGWTASRASIH